MPASPAKEVVSELATSPEQLLNYLQQLGIATHTYYHPPLVTVEESQQYRSQQTAQEAHCKCLFLKDKGHQLWLLVALENTLVDLPRLQKQLGSKRLSFGSPELLWQILKVRPGSVSPFAVINDSQKLVQVILEQQMMSYPLLHYHPLVNDRTTVIAREDLLTFLQACEHQPLLLDLPLPT